MALYPPTPSSNDSRLLIASNSSSQAITGAIGDVTGVALALAASTRYFIAVSIPITTVTGTSPTLQLGFNGPASPTLVSLKRHQMTSATAEAAAIITSFTTFAAAASVASSHHEVFGEVVTTSAGTIQLRAAAAGTTPSITIGAGCNIIAFKVS